MSITRALVCSLALATLLGACSKSEPPAAPTATAPAAAPAEPAAPTPAAPEPAAAPVAAAGVTGIAECDQFLTAYEQCVMEKMPEQARAQMQTGLEQWKTAWKDMANNATTKDSLPQICAQAKQSSAPALQAYGCTL